MTRTSGAAAVAAVAGGGTVPVVVPPPVCLVLGTTPIGPVAGYCPLDRILNFFLFGLPQSVWCLRFRWNWEYHR